MFSEGPGPFRGAQLRARVRVSGFNRLGFVFSGGPGPFRGAQLGARV